MTTTHRLMPCVYRRGLAAAALLVGAAAFCGIGNNTARAQQSTDMPAAVQPGFKVTVVRELIHTMRYDDDRSAAAGGLGQYTEITAETTLAYGLRRDLTLMLHLPVKRRFNDDSADRVGVDDGLGLQDPRVMMQHRIWQNDETGINTQRAVVQLGAELPLGADEFSSDSLDPIVGLAYTRIRGKHGLNASAQWKFTTDDGDAAATGFGDAIHDALMVTGSYLYRIAPRSYTIDTTGSHYVQFQALSFYETNGDAAWHFAPGYLYEGKDWAFEASVHLPIAQDLDDRPESEWGLSLGLRYLF
ncbi:MAG: hypothetical protein AAF328_00450 [Planctomycetota bacterium]